ncbi:MAG: alpha-glucan family phosphorylase [Pseudomonadota bacterium]|nr:alpha-glucan family phosphorylase [Pseudomonadota bacterium]
MDSIARFTLPSLPEGLEDLAELALDLRWSWSHATDKIWARIDPELWNATRNAWLLLHSVSAVRLKELAQDSDFCELVHTQLQSRRDFQASGSWFEGCVPEGALKGIAYFSMEFGLSEALPIYSGGLGILAGDHLKTASDLGLPLWGVGLMYQEGYFRQGIDAAGNQLAFYPHNDPSQLPVTPVRDEEGEWLRILVEIPGRTLRLRTWQVQVGRIRLYLLDSNDPMNSPVDRGITGQLYGGGDEMRLLQEIALGVGGWRLIEELGLNPEVCHLNEGHAAFLVLERAFSHMRKTGQDFWTSLSATRAGNVFTTHTPVAPGFDRFSPELFERYACPYCERLGISMKELASLGRRNPEDPSEPFNMAILAIRGSVAINGVSQLHADVSRRLFQPLFEHWPRSEVPVGYVTNGVHVPSWDSVAADKLWTRICGKGRWIGTQETLEKDIREASNEELWEFRAAGRKQLVDYARRRYVDQIRASGVNPEHIEHVERLLDPNVLTIGFARRFATYKRPDLLLYDPDRLVRLLTNADQPMQIIIAGKAHPADEAGKRIVTHWIDFLARSEVQNHGVFLADYDMLIAEQLVQGVDLWINTPRRPWEASGTSGMKVLVNGGLNLSELDGWWAEAYRPDLGWALGDGQEHGDDPAWDRQEAIQLYDLLEREIAPCFYTRDERGIPRGWVARMRASMSELTPRFSTNRMVREYTENYYLPAARAYRERIGDDGRIAAELRQWKSDLSAHWQNIHCGEQNLVVDGESMHFTLPVYLDDLKPEQVRVELFAEPLDGAEPEVVVMEKKDALAGAVNGFLYEASVPVGRPAEHYTARVVPFHPAATVPLEDAHIYWHG